MPASSEQSIHAISLALTVIRRGKEKNFIFFGLFMSRLEAINGFKLEIDIVQNITKDYTHLANSGKKKSFYTGYPLKSIFVATRG